MIEVIVSDRQTHNARAPSFQARVFGGPALCRSQTPVYEAARALIALGHDPAEFMTAYHEHPLKAINKPAKLGQLARWTVEDGKVGLRLREWTPHYRQKAVS